MADDKSKRGAGDRARVAAGEVTPARHVWANARRVLPRQG